jgi:hypothetical protein
MAGSAFGSSRPTQTRVRLLGERDPREHFGREHLGERAVRERTAGDAIRHLPRAPPARSRARREPQHDTHALFVVALGVQRLARAPIDRAHLARERARTELPCDLEPTLLIVWSRHPT